MAGVWWLPDNPEVTIAGILTYTYGKQIELRLIGAFDVSDEDQLRHQPLVLNGVAEGKRITLYENRLSNRALTGGLVTTKYRSSWAFIGHHINTDGNLRIRALKLEYSNLTEWSGFSGFRFAASYENGRFAGETVEYRFPEILHMRLPGADLSFDYTFHQKRELQSEVVLRQETFFKIVFDEPISFLRGWTDYASPIQDYLTFAIGTAAYVSKAYIHADGVFDIDTPELQQYRSIEVIHIAGDVVVTGRSSLHPLEMLFHLSDVRDEFETSLNTWFENMGRIKPVLDLYFSIRYSKEMYLEHQLLSLAQALEVLHRRTTGGRYLDAEAYGEFKARLVEAIPGELDRDLHNIFRQKLEFLNEYSLRKRLQDLIRQSGDTIEFLIPDSRRFILLLTDTRNYQTHYNPDLAGRAATGYALYWLVEQARFLLEVRLLFELGFTPEQIRLLVARNKRYGQLRQRLLELQRAD